jgi:hypothetical protein
MLAEMMDKSEEVVVHCDYVEDTSPIEVWKKHN